MRRGRGNLDLREDGPARRLRLRLLVSGGVAAVVCIAAPGLASATGAPLTAGSSATPSSLTNDTDLSTVALTLQGTTTTQSTPTDVEFVMDESGSIVASDFARERTFISDVTNQLAGQGLFTNGGRTGVVQFSGSARTTIPLTGDSTQFGTAVSGIKQAGGSTCFSCGLDAARTALTAPVSAPLTTPRKRLILFLTDGSNDVNTGTPFTTSVSAANAANIERFAIGVGSAAAVVGLDSVASAPLAGHVFSVSSFSDLTGVVGPLVAAVQQPNSTHLHVVATVNSPFQPKTASNGGTVSGQQISWDIPSLGADAQSLSYTVAHTDLSTCGTLPVNQSVVVTDDQGDSADVPPVNIDTSGCPGNLTLATPSSPVTYGDPDFAVTATGTPTAGPITVVGSGACMVDPAVPASGPGAAATTVGIKPTGAGDCILDATQEAGGGYDAATASTVHLPIAKATPSLSWDDLQPITYGTGLDSTQLNATESVPGLDPVAGSWSYTVDGAPATAGQVLNAGLHQLTASFSPTDTANVNPASLNKQLVVNKASQTVTFTNSPPVNPTAGGSWTPTFTSGPAGTTPALAVDPVSTGCALNGANVSFTAAGSCIVTLNQAGDANYLAAPQVQQAFTVAPFSWSGFLQPINADGSSIFKLGSTVPTKFALTGPAAGVTNLDATLSIAKVSNGVDGTYTEAVSTAAATTGNAFRYDSGQYVFNLSTKGLTAGTWRLHADFGNGASGSVLISLR